MRVVPTASTVNASFVPLHDFRDKHQLECGAQATAEPLIITVPFDGIRILARCVPAAQPENLTASVLMSIRDSVVLSGAVRCGKS